MVVQLLQRRAPAAQEKNHRRKQAIKTEYMKALYSTFEAISLWAGVVLFIALLIAVYRFRLINSTVICAGVTFMMYSLMHLIHKPLLTLESREIWYGTWVFLYGASVFLLYKSHDVLKVNLAKVTNKIAFTFCVGMFVQTARYMDREYFGGVYLEVFYPVAVNTVNISLAAILLVTTIKDKKEKLVGLYV